MSSKLIKEPKTFKYPRVYWTPDPISDVAELRIIYPNDWCRPERTRVNSYERGSNIFGDDRYTTCWYEPGMTPIEQVKAMKAYCKITGNELIFLGEVK